MDPKTIDFLAQRLADLSRRTVLQAAAGLATAALVGLGDQHPTTAACVKAGKRCGGDKKCCRGLKCRGGRCARPEMPLGSRCGAGDTCAAGACLDYAPGVAQFLDLTATRACLLTDGAAGCAEREDCQGGLCVSDVCGTIAFDQTCGAATDTCASIDQYRTTGPELGPVCYCALDVAGSPVGIDLDFIFPNGSGGFSNRPCASNAACGSGFACVQVQAGGFWCRGEGVGVGGFCATRC